MTESSQNELSTKERAKMDSEKVKMIMNNVCPEWANNKGKVLFSFRLSPFTNTLTKPRSIKIRFNNIVTRDEFKTYFIKCEKRSTLSQVVKNITICSTILIN